MKNLHAMLAASLLCAATDAGAADWMQFGYDAAHSGFNPVESQLTHSNVAQLSELPTSPASIPGTVDSAPVYLSGVVTASGTKNLLFALTRQNGTLLALDAANGSVVWSKTTGSGAQWITSAPAIDPGRLYVYSHGKDGNIHKYQVGDGTEITGGGWPQLYTNRPSLENANGSLALATWNGTSYLYSVTSGYFDSGDYQGHLTTVNLATGTQTVFNAICSNVTTHIAAGNLCDIGGSSGKAAIWGRGGATFDAVRGKVYIVSGNGPYNANATSGMNMNWGDSVLSLAPNGVGATPGVPYDSYTPTDYQSLDSSDIDLGSMSLALLPVPAGSSIPHVGMQGGKDDKLHVINLDDMSGGGGPRHVGGEMQLIDAGGQFNGGREQAAIWVDGSGATWVFFASFKNGLTAYKMSLGAGNVPTLTYKWKVYNGASTDTTSPVIANGVLYHIGSCGNDNCLIARDPATNTALYTSASLGGLHFQSPIVVDGHVYLFDANSKLRTFTSGTPPATFTVTPSAGPNGTISPSTPQTVNEGATTAFTVAPAAHYVAHATGCGGTLAGNVYTTAAITANCTVTASFSLETHTVTPTVTAGGTITPNTVQTVTYGDVIEFSVVPDVGGSILGVSGCSGALAGMTYTTAPVTVDCIVSAVFTGGDLIFRNGFESP